MNKYLKLFFLLAILGCLLYLPSIRGEFVFDDYKVIQDNPFIVNHGEISQLWKFDPTRFLPLLTLALNFWAAGNNTLFYHFFNLLLHVLCGLLVYVFVELILRAKGEPQKEPTRFWAPAAVAALIFLVHPIQTAAVSYISQRSTLMVTLFYLGAVCLYLYGRLSQKPWFYSLAFACGLLGAVCKPVIVTLPLAILLVEFFFVPTQDKPARRVLLSLPFFAIVFFVYFVLLLLKSSSANPLAIYELTSQTNVISRSDYLITQFNVLIKYIQLLFFPISQNLDYDFPVFTRFFDFPTLLSFCGLAMLVYVGIKTFAKKRWISFGIFWFLITLIPESSIFPIEDVIFEHRLYLAMLGFSALLVELLGCLRSRKIQAAVLLVFLTFFSVLTIQRNYLWSDAELILKDSIAKSPLKLRPRYNLGSLYLRRGSLVMAQEQILEAMRLSPADPTNYYYMGLLAEQDKDFDKAMAYYSQGVKSQKVFILANCFWKLGYLSTLKGKNTDAETFYKAALEVNPNFEEVHTDLGNLYNTTGKIKEAIAEYKKAIAVNPLSFNGHNGLAAAYVISGDYFHGIQEYLKLVRLFPESKTANMNLAKVYLLKRDPLNAEPLLKKAVELDPKDSEAHFYLGSAYGGLGQYTAARESLQKAIDILRASGREDEAKNLEKYLSPAQQQVAPDVKKSKGAKTGKGALPKKSSEKKAAADKTR